jgi:hypothetical protein
LTLFAQPLTDDFCFASNQQLTVFCSATLGNFFGISEQNHSNSLYFASPSSNNFNFGIAEKKKLLEFGRKSVCNQPTSRVTVTTRRSCHHSLSHSNSLWSHITFHKGGQAASNGNAQIPFRSRIRKKTVASEASEKIWSFQRKFT